MMGDGRFANF